MLGALVLGAHRNARTTTRLAARHPSTSQTPNGRAEVRVGSCAPPPHPAILLLCCTLSLPIDVIPSQRRGLSV